MNADQLREIRDDYEWHIAHVCAIPEGTEASDRHLRAAKRIKEIAALLAEVDRLRALCGRVVRQMDTTGQVQPNLLTELRASK